MKLYARPSCTASDSVRVVLKLKDIDHELITVPTGQPLPGASDHPLLNQHALLPVLFENQRLMIEALAIAEYLEETYPEPSLLPGGARERVRIRALAQRVMSEIAAPLSPPRRAWIDEHGCPLQTWTQDTMDQGFAAMEALLADNPATGSFCLGDSPTLADVCLAPQIWNAEALGLDLPQYPTIMGIYESCMELEAFSDVAPSTA